MNKKKGLSVLAAHLSKKYGYEVTAHLVIYDNQEMFIVKDKKGFKVAQHTPAQIIIIVLEMLEC